jgi:AraC-like DNA-binding protein
MLQSILKRLLVQCTRAYKKQIGYEEIAVEVNDIVREYHFLVEKHFKQKHQVADYAQLLSKSPKTLSNIFKKLGNKSPQQFIKDRKMLEARRLLAYSSLTVSEVGVELGFSDVQSFSRFFKREQGVSPNMFKS